MAHKTALRNDPEITRDRAQLLKVCCGPEQLCENTRRFCFRLLEMEERQAEVIEYSAFEFVLFNVESEKRTKIRHPDDTEVHQPCCTQVSWSMRGQLFSLFRGKNTL